MFNIERRIVYLLIVLVGTASNANCSDITQQAFGAINDTIISAFGDFNSDELTDIFVRSTDGRKLMILLASYVEPLLRQSPSTQCNFTHLNITSIVPGDFDGDAYMDLLITSISPTNSSLLDIYINWGGLDTLICADENAEPLFRTIGEPMALDYNQDMIIDLFGLDENGTRTFWIFEGRTQIPQSIIPMNMTDKKLSELVAPNANAYLDLNNDFKADLFLETKSGFEVWLGVNGGFEYNYSIGLPTSVSNSLHGNSIFLDIELNGSITQILPLCYDAHCEKSAIIAQVNGEYHDLQINFKDDKNQMWQLISPRENNQIYQKAISLRGGDFNLDGFPDLLVTLKMSTSNRIETFLMENVQCPPDMGQGLTRSFKIQWNAFSPYGNGTVMGAFYDFLQDGILDVIFVGSQVNGTSKPIAFRNALDYDANFVKVMVLTGLTNKHTPAKYTPLGKQKRTYGTNLPGPRIAYHTTKPDGGFRNSTSVQIPQSSYFALHLPYTIFGLGRTANFLDSLSVGLSGRHRAWTQVIPNSQMVVVPWPTNDPIQWKAQLFVTPSKLIWMSVISLGATCVVITIIILILHVKERQMDQFEKLQESQPFHFDAM